MTKPGAVPAPPPPKKKRWQGGGGDFSFQIGTQTQRISNPPPWGVTLPLPQHGVVWLCRHPAHCTHSRYYTATTTVRTIRGIYKSSRHFSVKGNTEEVKWWLSTRPGSEHQTNLSTCLYQHLCINICVSTSVYQHLCINIYVSTSVYQTRIRPVSDQARYHLLSVPTCLEPGTIPRGGGGGGGGHSGTEWLPTAKRPRAEAVNAKI